MACVQPINVPNVNPINRGSLNQNGGTLPNSQRSQGTEASVNPTQGRSTNSSAELEHHIQELLRQTLEFAKESPSLDVDSTPGLGRNIAIPLTVEDGNARFARAFGSGLQNRSITPPQFAAFLDGLNVIQSINHLTAAPTIPSVSAKAPLTTYLTRANQRFFVPRGLHVRLSNLQSLLSSINPHESKERIEQILKINTISSDPQLKAGSVHPLIEPLHFNLPPPAANSIALQALAANLITSYPSSTAPRPSRNQAAYTQPANEPARNAPNPPHHQPNDWPRPTDDLPTQWSKWGTATAQNWQKWGEDIGRAYSHPGNYTYGPYGPWTYSPPPPGTAGESFQPPYPYYGPYLPANVNYSGAHWAELGPRIGMAWAETGMAIGRAWAKGYAGAVPPAGGQAPVTEPAERTGVMTAAEEKAPENGGSTSAGEDLWLVIENLRD